MKKHNIMPTIVLGAICLVVALLLSLVNSVTAPIIEATQNAAANEALVVVLPDGKNFEEIAITEKYPASITKGYKAEGGLFSRLTLQVRAPDLLFSVESTRRVR